GLAWTSVGGEILYIETSLSKGKAGKLTLTGNLGDVMKESAIIALEYVKSHIDLLQVDYRIFEQWNIHIHVPEGATPKDGPSAGITIATSIASAITQRKVRANTAMTGEITLRGKVLPVGGIKEKILAAKRAGIKHIVMCRENQKNVEEIPEKYLKGVDFHYVENVADVWQFALTDEKVKNPTDFSIEENDTVGTVGSVKGVHFEELKKQVMAQIILGNTYHLYLRPGLDVIRAAGGLHKFNGWDRPILTDSGGFQVFSLTGIRKLKEEGCEFRSHIDGSKHFFTPENVMDTERIIGADIMMAFDECPPGQSDYQYAKNSLMLTQRWLDRCIKRFNETEPLYGYQQSLFPIVQGCTFPELRREAAKYIADKGADGNAIGGLAVGEPTEVMYEMIEVVNEILPKDKPRYLMGVGTPQNILEAIERGVDMFDCVMPTRNGRNAMLFTYQGTMYMRNKKW
ncbi:tRNA guanosine(34) transglycosylase Tgt, partial [Prevotella copri]|nr:tRNA guanosine(34) transglycosylase Tgt [Segatella copri]